MSQLTLVEQPGFPPKQAAQPDPPEPESDSQPEDLAGLTPVAGTQRKVESHLADNDVSDLTPVAGTQRNIDPNLRTGGRVVGPSGVVRDDFGTHEHEPFLSQPKGQTSIGPQEHGFHSWLQNVQNDVRDGSDTTWFGAMLKRMGNTGTRTGVSEGTAGIMETVNPLAALPLGLSKLGQGGIEFMRQTPEVIKHIAQGDDLRTAIIKASVDNPDLVKKATIGVNKMVGGAFQAAGPLALASPTGALEAVPTITGAMVAQHIATKTATAMGADPDTAELVGNVAAIGAGHTLNEKINPLTKRFGAAVNDRTAAEAEYVNRVRNVETARGQQVQAQSDALDAAQQEAKIHSDPKTTPQQRQEATQKTVEARQNANDAAANVTDAQKAADVATKNRADAIVTMEKLHRQIKDKADEANAAFDEKFTSESDKAKDYFQKAVPSKGAHRYDAEDYDVWRSYMEQAKRSGAKINSFEDAYNHTEAQRQGIEDSLDPAVEKLKNNPITTNPFEDVMNNLDELAKFEPGIKEAANEELSKYNMKDLNVEEARQAIKQLNDKNRAEMKNKSNWDVSQMMTNDPAFAARYLAVKSLREGFYGALKEAGVEGAEKARGEEASLIQVRDAIGAQLRANRGGTTVRGSGEQSAVRGAIAKLTGKVIHAAATAKGAAMGGPEGAIIGSVVGEHVAEPVEDFIAPRDITRDEHIKRSFNYRGTLRRPTKITGIEGATPSAPSIDLPPEIAEQMPSAVPKVPRENTELHAELAAHYLEPIGDSTYQQLEDRLKQDIKVKNANDPTSVTPAEKKLFTEINKLDVQDRAAAQKANEADFPPKSGAPTTPEQEKANDKARQEAAIKAGTGQPASTVTLSPVVPHEDSAMVSHSPAMKAIKPAAEFNPKDLPEGTTSADVHREEWAHTAMGAIDGLEPIEIRSDSHPKNADGALASSVFDAAQIKDADGKYNPEMLKHQLAQWVTQKMAGPASHEVFRGADRAELKTDAAHRADFREARQMIREVNPDLTSKEVEEQIDAAYDRAHSFLSKSHIADRVRANAAVREEGLPETLHASHGRLNQFAEDIRKAHNENEGIDTEPNGGGDGEGSEKPAPKPESGADGGEGTEAERGGKAENGEEKNEGRNSRGSKEEPRGDDGEVEDASGRVESPDRVTESSNIQKGFDEQKYPHIQGVKVTWPDSPDQPHLDAVKGLNKGHALSLARKNWEGADVEPLEESSNFLRKSQVPPEKTTGDTDRDEAIRQGGAIPGGTFGDELSMFHSPQTGSTLALKHADVTPENVKAKLDASNALFTPEQKIAPEEASQFSKDQEKGLISTRQPSGKKADGDPLKEDLKIGRDSIDSVEGLPEKVAAKILKYKGIKIPKAAAKNPTKVIDAFTQHLVGNLKDLYSRVPKNEADNTAKWYDSANKMANDFAEKNDVDEKQMSGVIAAMSPQKDWDQNVSLAGRVADAYSKHADEPMTPEMEKRGQELSTNMAKGKLTNPKIAGVMPKIIGKSLNELTEPVERAAWVRIYDEAHNPRSYDTMDPGTGDSKGTALKDDGTPRKVAWGSLNEIGKALSILKDGSRENISEQLGDAHKVRNFYNNILDPNNPAGHVTIDTHAVAAALQRPLSGKSIEVKDNFGGVGSAQSGAEGLYGLYADAYRQAAGELGIQPRQLQSVVWEEVRKQYPAIFKAQAGHVAAVDKIWNQYRDGKISLDKTRATVRDYAGKTVAELNANKKGAKVTEDEGEE